MLQYGPLVLQFNEMQKIVGFKVLGSKGGLKPCPNELHVSAQMVAGDYVRIPSVSGLLQFTMLDMCLIEVHSLIEIQPHIMM